MVYDLSSSSSNQPSELGLLSSIKEPIPKDQLPTTDMKDSIATGDDSDSDFSQVSDCGASPPDRKIFHWWMTLYFEGCVTNLTCFKVIENLVDIELDVIYQ